MLEFVNEVVLSIKKKGSVEKFPKIENFVVHKKKNAPNRISNS